MSWVLYPGLDEEAVVGYMLNLISKSLVISGLLNNVAVELLMSIPELKQFF